jgi:hypothetical protein
MSLARATPALLHATRTGAALTTGWICLLLWTAADPAPRRVVMLLTVVPVIGAAVRGRWFLKPRAHDPETACG